MSDDILKIKSYEFRLLCNTIREDDQTIGDFLCTKTQGWETPNGINGLMFSAVAKLMFQAQPYFNDRIELVRFLQELGLLDVHGL